MQFLSAIVNKNSYVCILLLALGALVYSPVMNGPFIFDDDMFILNNKQVHSLANIPQMLVSSTSDRTIDVSSNFYRPLQQIAYSFLYAIFGPNPTAFHLFSIILHSLNAFLIFLLFTKLFNEISKNHSYNSAISKKEKKSANPFPLKDDYYVKVSALIGGFFFLLHPINSEAVCYISGLADVLGLFFMLNCLLLVIKLFSEPHQFMQYTILAIAAFLLTLLAKENMVILFPFTLLTYYFFYQSIEQKQHFKIRALLGIFMLFTVTYVYLKFTVLNFTGNTGLTNDQNAYTESIYVRLLSFIHIFPEYIRMIFFPVQLNYEKPYSAYTNLKSIESVLGLMSLVILFGIFIFSFIRKYKTVFFPIAWICIALAPFSGILPLNAIYLEHWLYFPMVCVSMLIALLFLRLSGSTMSITMVLLVPIFILFSMRTAVRASEWADIEKFYTNELKYTSNAIRVYNNLAMYYAEHKKPHKALQYYEKALKIQDTFPQVHHNMANLYHDMGDPNKAIEEYYKALKLNPNFYYSLGKMVNLCLDNNMNEKAKEFRSLYDRASTRADVQLVEIEKAFNGQ